MKKGALILFLIIVLFSLSFVSAVEVIEEDIGKYIFYESYNHTPMLFIPIRKLTYINNLTDLKYRVQVIEFNDETFDSENLDGWITKKTEKNSGTLTINGNIIFINEYNNIVLWRSGNTYVQITDGRKNTASAQELVESLSEEGEGGFSIEIIKAYLAVYPSDCNKDGCKINEYFENNYNVSEQKETKISLSQIDYEERKKNIKGITFSLNNIFQWVFEKLFGFKRHELSVEIIESVTQEGTHLKINGEDVYIPSGGTKYIGGWLVIHRGNIEAPNGTIYSDINSFYVGLDEECGLGEHYECINNELHWLYCNGTDYGMVEECDVCGDNECIKKGTFARYERIKEFKENQSKSMPHEEGTASLNRKEDDSLETAVSGIMS